MRGGEGACEKNEGGGVMQCMWWKEYIHVQEGREGRERWREHEGEDRRGANACGGNSGHMRRRRGGEGKCFGQSECM